MHSRKILAKIKFCKNKTAPFYFILVNKQVFILTFAVQITNIYIYVRIFTTIGWINRSV